MEANLQATVELLDSWINSGECLGGQIFVSHEGEVVADLAMGSMYLAPRQIAHIKIARETVYPNEVESILYRFRQRAMGLAGDLSEHIASIGHPAHARRDGARDRLGGHLF